MLKKDFDDFSKEIPEMHDNVCDKIYAKHQSKVNKENTFLKFITRKAFAIPCLIVFLLCIFSTGIYATVEAKEYQEAVDFFEDNELSLEGLSRTEIKKVYKDITTNSFSYDATLEVIISSVTKNVPGYKINYELDFTEAKELWYNWDKVISGKFIDGFYYEIEKEYDNNSIYPNPLIRKELVKYDKFNVVWRIDIIDYEYIDKVILIDGLLYCYNSYLYDCNDNEIIIVNPDNGNILKAKKYNLGNLDYVRIISLVKNTDSTITIFSRIDKKDFCMITFDSELNIISTIKKDIKDYDCINAVIFQDGYLLSGVNNVIKIDKEGNIESEFEYELGEKKCRIVDMIEYNGKIYLSTYEFPKYNGSNESGSRSTEEVRAITDYLHDIESYKNGGDVTDLFRNHYTATLLIVDSQSGEPYEFYSVKGAFGGALSIDENGNLNWDVENIFQATYVPMYSSTTYIGKCNILLYEFSSNVELNSITDKGEVIDFRRL